MDRDKQFHSIKLFLEQITNAEHIAIISHIKPDADAICSMVALRKLIHLNNKTGIQKHIDMFAETDHVEEIFKPILNGDPFNQQRYDSYDLIIGLDSPNPLRFGIYENVWAMSENTINIDHHETNSNFAKNNLVMKTTSTAEMIYTIFTVLNQEVSDSICRVIYGGLITDTANLSQGTFTSKSFKMIANFKQRGIDIEGISGYFFKNNTISKTLLLQKALKSLKFTARNSVAIMRLTKSDFTEVEGTFADTEGIANHAINIKGVKIAMIMIKQEDNSYYISLRSKEGANVAEIASKFGGGGHETMAAFKYSGTIAELKPTFVKACQEQLAKIEETNTDYLFFDENDELKNVDTSDKFEIE